MQDTDELRNFRENWKTELQSARAAAAHARGQQHPLLHNTNALPLRQAHAQAKVPSARLPLTFNLAEGVEENPLVAAFSQILLDEPPEEDEKNILHAFPVELLLLVLSHLDVYTLEIWSVICRTCYVLARDQTLPQYPTLCFQVWPLTGPSEFKFYRSNWRTMYINRPRIRTDGVYISRNHYLRPGQTEGSYYQPVHDVIYYRYLRFYPDGRVLSASSADEPKKAIEWLKLSRAQATPSIKHPLHCGTYMSDEADITLWHQMSFYSLCLKVELFSTKPGRNDRLSFLQCLCQANDNLSDFSEMRVKKFQFAKIPKRILDMEMSGEAEDGLE